MSCYLITGGCGFIGSHLAEKLIQQNHQVIVLDDLSTGKRENLSPSAELIIGDICDRQLLVDIFDRIDGCFHLAAEVGITRCQEDWLGTHRVNVTGTITVFDVASYYVRVKKKVIPIVYASSSAVYGEADELQPISAYGADKLSCELHGYVASYGHHVPTIGLRFFNVYGPRQDPHSPYSGVIPIFIEHALQKKPVTIFGDGEQTRDFISVYDVVEHCLFFMKNKQFSPSVFNVCTGIAITINTMVDWMSEFLHYPIEKIYHPKRVGDVLHSCGDPTKTKQCGITATITFKEGLKELLKTYTQWK